MIGHLKTSLVTRFLRYNDLFPPNDILAKGVRVLRMFIAAKLYRTRLRLIHCHEHVLSWKFLFILKFPCSNIGNMTHFPHRIVCRPVSCEGVCRIYFGRVFRNACKIYLLRRLILEAPNPFSKLRHRLIMSFQHNR
jgi:hypothetical protein